MAVEKDPSYSPELGQALFGNAYGECDLGQNEDFVASELHELSRILGERDSENQRHGMLGGEWGYGQEFSNETFTMFPYYWGDCACGYDEAEYEWEKAHGQHSEACWHTRYYAEHERLYALSLEWDELSKREDEWATANGWDGSPGIAVHCDCGTNERWYEWSAKNAHDPKCPKVRPNFTCGDVEVRWYKYIGRGMSVNAELSRAQWRTIFAACFASVSA